MSDYEPKVGDIVRYADDERSRLEVMGVADAGLFLAAAHIIPFGEHPKDKARRAFFSKARVIKIV